MVGVSDIRSKRGRLAAVVRTAVFLMIGGLLAVPYAAVAAWIAQLSRFDGDNKLAVPSGLLIGAGLLMVPATLKVMRTLERTAANELLGTALAEPPGSARAGDIARGAAWFLLHLATGALAVVVLVFVMPVLVSYGVAPFAGGLAVTGPLAAQLLPGADPLAGTWIVLATCAGALGILVLAASQLRVWAVLLLGPSERGKLAIAERRALELARRNELARELHDSIGHALAITTLQAAAARRLIETNPAKAAEAMVAVEETGRAAMEELDQVLGVLRAPADPEELPEQQGSASPGLAELHKLVARHRSAGLHATLHVAGDTGAVPGKLAREAYRIVQEGLTNVAKHGCGSRCEIDVSVVAPGAKGCVLIGIRNPVPDDGAAPAGPQSGPLRSRRSGRHGLAGLQERTVLLGGSLRAGASDGWWRLEAELPWQSPGKGDRK